MKKLPEIKVLSSDEWRELFIQWRALFISSRREHWILQEQVGDDLRVTIGELNDMEPVLVAEKQYFVKRCKPLK